MQLGNMTAGTIQGLVTVEFFFNFILRPFLWGERCMTSKKMAAKETTSGGAQTVSAKFCKSLH